MKRFLELTIFASAFFLIYFGMHYFTFSNLIALFNSGRSWLFYLIIVLLSLSYISAAILERSFPNKFSREFYYISTVWFGAIFLLFFMVLIYYFLSFFVESDKLLIGAGIIFLDCILVLYCLRKAKDIKIKNINLKSDKIKKNLKFVQLSDLHLGTINTAPFLQKIVNLTNVHKPDFVVLTGDLVDGSAPLKLEMLKPLDKIKVPLFFVIGNHEIYDDLEFVLPILKKIKMRILRNRVINYEGIQIAGVDFYEGKKEVIKKIGKLKIDKKRFCILLNHAPTGFDEAIEKGVDLMLSGHTHGGQIFPFIILVRIAYKYISGLYNKGKSHLYVSQGTGTCGPPMRLGTESEIAVFNLNKSNS